MKEHVDFNLIWLLVVGFMAALLWANTSHAKDARTVKLDDKKMAKIFVKTGRTTIINFPVKPSKVILGNSSQFAIQYIESDLAISPLVAGAQSNVFVYLQGRRFGFDLVPSASSDEVVIVRDILDRNVPVRIKND